MTSENTFEDIAFFMEYPINGIPFQGNMFFLGNRFEFPLAGIIAIGFELHFFFILTLLGLEQS